MSQKHHKPVSVAAQGQADIKRAEILWKQAELFFRHKQYEAAVDAGEVAIEQVKDNPLAFELRGNWEKQLDAWRVKVGDPEAIERFWRRKVFGLLPGWLVLVVAIIIAAVGGTKVLHEPVLKLSDHFKHQAEVSRLVEAGVLALDRGQLIEAREQFKIAQAKDGLDRRAQLGLAITDVYDMSNGQYDPVAIDSRLAALKASTENVPLLHPHVMTIEGNLWFHQGQLNIAAASYLAAIGARPTIAEAHANLGTVRAFQLKFPAAQEQFRRALALSPANQTIVSGLGYVSAALDDYAGAMKQYEQVLRVEPERLQERLELATLLRIFGRFEEALNQQRRVATEFDKWMAQPKNAEPWALLVYRHPRESPWVTQELAEKKFYLEQNLAGTECLLGQMDAAAQHKNSKSAAQLSKKDVPASVRNLVALELQTIVERDPKQTDRVQQCVAWLRAIDGN